MGNGKFRVLQWNWSVLARICGFFKTTSTLQRRRPFGRTVGSCTRCSSVWCSSVVFERGVRVWCSSVVFVRDVRAWYSSVVFECGVRVWYSSVVFECGIRVWYSSVVFERGVRAWCSSAKRNNFKSCFSLQHARRCQKYSNNITHSQQF